MRLVNRKYGTAEYFHYEDVCFSEALRTRIARLAEHECSLFCACCRENTVELKISRDGRFVYDMSSPHTTECRRYFSDLTGSLARSAAGGFMHRRGILKVSFNWTEDAKPSASVITERDFADRKTALSFSSWIAIVNSLSFVSRSTTAKPLLGSAEQAMSFLFTAGMHPVNNPRGKEHDALFDDAKLFLSENSMFGLFYGKVDFKTDIDYGEKRTYLYLGSTGLDGRHISFRVKAQEFLRLCQDLPDKDSIWICGFIKKRELKFDNSIGAVRGLKASAPLPTIGPYIQDTYTKLVKEMRFYRLFACNNAGMIVFSRDELSRSNCALAAGLPLYRPLFGNGIFIYNPNGEDQKI